MSQRHENIHANNKGLIILPCTYMYKQSDPQYAYCRCLNSNYYCTQTLCNTQSAMHINAILKLLYGLCA